MVKGAVDAGAARLRDVFQKCGVRAGIGDQPAPQFRLMLGDEPEHFRRGRGIARQQRESLSGGGEEPPALTAVTPSPVHAVAEHASVCRECSCVWLVWLDCAEAVVWPSLRGDARTASPRDSAVAAMSSPVMAFACGSPFVVLMCRGGEPCRWLSRTGGRCGPATACNQKKCFIDVNSSLAGWVFGQKWLSSSVCMHCARLT